MLQFIIFLPNTSIHEKGNYDKSSESITFYKCMDRDFLSTSCYCCHVKLCATENSGNSASYFIGLKKMV